MELFYLDNAATTKPFVETAKIYNDVLNDYYNPSALYAPALLVRKKIENARKHMAEVLGGENGKIIFTASATEADNMALNMVKIKKDNSLVVSVGEHPAVYSYAKKLENDGLSVIYLPLNSDGTIDIEKLKTSVTKNTQMVSIMHVSNETGAINNIKEIVKIVKSINANTLVHSDGVQAVGKVKIDLMDLGVDMYTFTAHKIHGPKGIGALWVKNGINMKPIIYGGGQENGLRSGTENVFEILAMDYALEKVCRDYKINLEKIENANKTFMTEFNKYNINYTLNSKNGSPYIINMSIDGIRGEVLVHELEKYNIYISTGSACSSKKPDNRTLSALKLSADQIKGTIRISFSAYEDYDYAKLAKIIATEIIDLTKRIRGK